MANFIVTDKIPNYDSSEIIIAKIDGKKSKTLAKFYKTIGKELNFPEYFGGNLDAFDEMINDLTWLEHEAAIIIITNLEELLADEENEEDEDIKGLILSLLDQAADEQKVGTEGTPIKILIEKSDFTENYLNEIGIDFLRN